MTDCVTACHSAFALGCIGGHGVSWLHILGDEISFSAFKMDKVTQNMDSNSQLFMHTFTDQLAAMHLWALYWMQSEMKAKCSYPRYQLFRLPPNLHVIFLKVA